MVHLPPGKLAHSQQDLQFIMVVLNWLACGTRLNIDTITNMLAQHLSYANQAHVAAAKYIV
eukprot:6139277-Ditylum_brightwellii.AAC.1